MRADIADIERVSTGSVEMTQARLWRGKERHKAKSQFNVFSYVGRYIHR